MRVTTLKLALDMNTCRMSHNYCFSSVVHCIAANIYLIIGLDHEFTIHASVPEETKRSDSIDHVMSVHHRTRGLTASIMQECVSFIIKRLGFKLYKWLAKQLI